MDAERRKRKDILVSQINSQLGQEQTNHFLELLHILRDEARESSDTCTVRSFLRNQGEIRAYTDLIRSITFGPRGGRNV